MFVDFGFGLFLLQFAIHPFSTNWQSAGVSECTCSKYRFLQTPEICVVCLFATAWNMCRVPIYQNVFFNSLEYVPGVYLPNCSTFLIIDNPAADKKTQKKCWCLFRVCNPAVNLVFLLPNGTTCVFSSLLCLVFHVQRQSCRHSETSLWLRTCVFSFSSLIVCIL